MIDLDEHSRRFFGWLDNVYEQAPQSPVGKIMTANNYTIAHTGGGCLAWERMIDDQHYLWICDVGNGLGDSVDEQFYVGVYDAEGAFDQSECKGIKNALRWCDKRHADPDRFIKAFGIKDAKRWAKHQAKLNKGKGI